MVLRGEPGEGGAGGGVEASLLALGVVTNVGEDVADVIAQPGFVGEKTRREVCRGEAGVQKEGENKCRN